MNSTRTSPCCARSKAACACPASITLATQPRTPCPTCSPRTATATTSQTLPAASRRKIGKGPDGESGPFYFLVKPLNDPGTLRQDRSDIRVGKVLALEE